MPKRQTNSTADVSLENLNRLRFSSHSLDASKLIGATDVAKITGENPDVVTRRCRTIGKAAGWAVQAFCPVTLQPDRWFMLRSTDPRFASDYDNESLRSALDALTEKQYSLCLQRADCARRYRYEKNHSRDLKTVWLPRLQAALRSEYPSIGKLSETTLFEWEQKSDGGTNPAALADQRGGRQVEKISPEAWKCFRDIFLDQNARDIADASKKTRKFARGLGLRWFRRDPTQAVVNRVIPPETQLYNRDPEKWQQQLSPFTEQHVDSWRANERWVSDGKTLDLWVRYRNSIVRPVLIAFIDWRTRRIVGWFLSCTEDNSSILAAFGNALRDPTNMGGPNEIAIDNGASYSSALWMGSTKAERRRKLSFAVDEQQTRGIYGFLKIKVHFAIPFGPNGKARQERWNRNLTSFARNFETFCGIDSDSKPERLAEVLSNPSKIPTFEEVDRQLAEFIDEYNNNAEHAMNDLSEDGVRLSPNQAFAKWADTRRVLADAAVLDLVLAHWHKPVTMTRNGLSLIIGGRTYRYGHTCEALRPFKSLRKKDRPILNVSYDPDALESVKVYDSQFRFVTVAAMNRVGGVVQGMTREDHAETRRQMAAYRKSLKHQAEYSLTSILTPEEHLAMTAANRQCAERLAAESAAKPASLKIVQTPLDGNTKAIQKQTLRIAVGAESLSESKPRVDLLERIAAMASNAPAARPAARPDLLEKLYPGGAL